MIELRPYQVGARDASLAAFAQGKQRIIYALPTGTGKTVTFGAIHLAILGEGSTVLIAHREELLEQGAEMFRWADPQARVEVEQGTQRSSPDADIVVASIQTLQGGKRLEGRKLKLIIVDEAHHAVSPSYLSTLKRLGCFDPNGPLLVGCTATPKRLDKLNLASVFEEQVFTYSMRQAIEEGYLCDVVGYRVRTDVNLDGIKTLGGDFNQSELASAVIDAERTRRVLSHWWKVARKRPTIAFCASVEHAQIVANELKSKGFGAEYVHGGLPKAERRAIIQRLKSGETQIVTNVEILTEGFDYPALSCVLMMRPTQSWGLYSQMVGRGTRLCAGKDCLIVIDVVDNCRRHSLAAVPAILDLPPSLDLEGQSLLKAAKFIDTLGTKASLLNETKLPDTFSALQSMLEKVDLFASVEPPIEVKENSQFTWVKIAGDHYYLSCGTTQNGAIRREAHLRQDLIGAWILQLCEDGNLIAGLGPTPTPIEKALPEADQYLETIWPGLRSLAGAAALWRTDPPSPRQIGALRRFGYDESVLQKLTKGQASNLLSAAFAKPPL